MTENEPVCRATLNISWVEKRGYDCVRHENHRGPHQDNDGDSWDITYRDEPKRPATTVYGETLRDLGERLDRIVLGTLEEIRVVARRIDKLEQTSADGAATDDLFVTVNRRLSKLEDGMHPEECHGEQCVKPTVLAVRVDGHRVMSDGSVREPACLGTYIAPVDEQQGNYLHGRTHDDLIKELYQRISHQETRINPVCGHRDPSSGRTCQKPPDHCGEVHRDMSYAQGGIVWTTSHSSEEHQAGRRR